MCVPKGLGSEDSETRCTPRSSPNVPSIAPGVLVRVSDIRKGPSGTAQTSRSRSVFKLDKFKDYTSVVL